MRSPTPHHRQPHHCTGTNAASTGNVTRSTVVAATTATGPAGPPCHSRSAARLAARGRSRRVALAPALIVAGVLAHASGADAQSGQSSVRTRILDACVYDLYFQQRSSERATERCRCAAGKLASTVTPEEAASYRVGSRLTGTLRDKVYAALDGC